MHLECLDLRERGDELRAVRVAGLIRDAQRTGQPARFTVERLMKMRGKKKPKKSATQSRMYARINILV